MAAGYGCILDASIIEAFGRESIKAFNTIYKIDMRAEAIIIPATALAEALVPLESPEDAERALFLRTMGVVIGDSLTSENAESVAIARLTAKSDEATLGMAHTAVVARKRSWPVITVKGDIWRTTYPDVGVSALS